MYEWKDATSAESILLSDHSFASVTGFSIHKDRVFIFCVSGVEGGADTLMCLPLNF
jgi:hypothetical protein